MVQWGKRMEEGRTLSNTTTQDRPVCGRLAPSPSGRMHLGNLWSALLAWLAARSRGGRMVLRLEDLDPDRCTQTWCDQVMRDLEWLGLDWDNEPVYQSRRTDAYRAAFARLEEAGLIYPCYCTRAERLAGLIPEYAPISPAELIPLFSWEKLPQADCAVHWADGICTFFTKTIQSPVQRDRPPV